MRRLFTAIAPRYDFLNHLLSLNVDRAWRRAAVARLGWEARPDGVYLDLCAGTLDLAATLARAPGFRGRVVGADFVVPMLARGIRKAPRAAPVAADALELPFPDASFDGATVGFGVRNLADLEAGLVELRRVLRPEGRLAVLEITRPRGLLAPFYRIWFDAIVPVLGKLLPGGSAYTYLPASVKRFPGPENLAGRLRAAGFEDVRYRLFAGGIVALHTGVAK